MADVLTDTFWQPADMTDTLRLCGVLGVQPPVPAHMAREQAPSVKVCVYVCMYVCMWCYVCVCMCVV